MAARKPVVGQRQKPYQDKRRGYRRPKLRDRRLFAARMEMPGRWFEIPADRNHTDFARRAKGFRRHPLHRLRNY